MLIGISVECYYSDLSYPECHYSECSGTKFKVADTLCGIFAKCNIFVQISPAKSDIVEEKNCECNML